MSPFTTKCKNYEFTKTRVLIYNQGGILFVDETSEGERDLPWRGEIEKVVLYFCEQTSYISIFK